MLEGDVLKKIPEYMKVYGKIKQSIRDGDYSVGDLLPPEPELEKMFNVSRTTIRKAIEMLSHDGFVHVKQGKGTTITDYKTMQNLNIVTSISETLRSKGMEVKSRNAYIDFINASSTLASDFQVKPESKIVRIQRIQLANDMPIVIMKNYLIPEMVPGIEECTNQIYSLYKFLEDKYGIYINSATDRITAKAADFTEAEMLQVKIGAPLLYMKRICCQDGTPVCIDVLSIVAERYEFELKLTGRASPL